MTTTEAPTTAPAVVDEQRRAREVTRRARRVQQQMDEVNRQRREIVRNLMREGLRQSEIAALLDVSRQRIGQIVDELREAGELPPSCHEEGAPADE